eukprot:Tbor_TRINITY_DN5501_c9_g1::TRINITY_DN5501_c9_g1_i1::g.13560::m.13560
MGNWHSSNNPANTTTVVGNGNPPSTTSLKCTRKNPNRPMLTPEEVCTLPLVSHYVYACLADHVYQDPDRRPLPAGWTEFIACDALSLEREGYYSAAFVNHKLRHCIIAEKGTSDAQGFRAGVWMYFDEPTIQFSLAEQFSKLVRLRLLLTIKDWESSPYFISYTGHSLGAVLAATRAVAEHTYAITFESPGCRTFVDKTMHPFKADDADIITYQRSPNPINTLRPQCGYLVQLPYCSSSVVPRQQDNAVTSRAKRLTFQIPSPQHYLRSKLLERGMPELQQYLTTLEPIIKELLDHTQQQHSITSIVDQFEEEEEPLNQELILQWPTHFMQFVEYFNITKALEDPSNQNPNTLGAYKSMLSKLYLVCKRERNRISLRHLSIDSKRLLRIWPLLTDAQIAESPLTYLEQRVLNTAEVHEDSFMISDVLTAFQMKQFLSLLVAREAVVAFLSKLYGSSNNVPRSKL